jgi:4-amino-4-deoxy-L-arabinose transferase-like glycosyltransferase
MRSSPELLTRGVLAAVVLTYLHNAVPYLTMLPRINVDEPWLIERAYQLATTGSPSQPMFLLDRGYLLQPGHSLLLAPWIDLFGVGLMQSRALAVLCGFAAVLGVYALGRLLFGVAAGAIAAMFIATDSNFLGIARMARTDAPSVMFVAFGLAFALHGLRASRPLHAFIGGLATGMAILCHANSYWVGVIVFLWYVAAFGWRVVMTPTAYAYAAGLSLTFGPYLALIALNWQDFNAQLQMFAIERVPGFSLSTLWFQISQEPLRYRDWYFGLITNATPNPVLRVFQFSSAAGAVFVAWRVWAGRRTTASVRPETFAAILLFGSVLIFAALIPNKALVYLPHLLVGFAVVSGAVIARGLEFVPALRPIRGAMPHAAAVFVLGQAIAAVVLYQDWYGAMQKTELRPYEETHAIIESMVPPGPKYLVASPTFWLPFYNRPEVKFVAYTAAGPYDTVEPQGFFTRQRLFDLPQDRPFYLLVDETEWRAVLEDPAYDPYWRQTWIAYIRTACAAVRVAFGTSQGTLALYRCWDDRHARRVTPEYSFEGRSFVPAGRAWAADAERLATWNLYRPGTQLVRNAESLQVSASAGGGIYADVPVEAGAGYLLRADVDGATGSDLISIHELSAAGNPIRSRWVKLAASDWFPSGTVVHPSTSSLRIYVYSETRTDFHLKSIELIRLAAVNPGDTFE